MQNKSESKTKAIHMCVHRGIPVEINPLIIAWAIRPAPINPTVISAGILEIVFFCSIAESDET